MNHKCFNVEMEREYEKKKELRVQDTVRFQMIKPDGDVGFRLPLNLLGELVFFFSFSLGKGSRPL